MESSSSIQNTAIMTHSRPSQQPVPNTSTQDISPELLLRTATKLYIHSMIQQQQQQQQQQQDDTPTNPSTQMLRKLSIGSISEEDQEEEDDDDDDIHPDVDDDDIKAFFTFKDQTVDIVSYFEHRLQKYLGFSAAVDVVAIIYIHRWLNATRLTKTTTTVGKTSSSAPRQQPLEHIQQQQQQQQQIRRNPGPIGAGIQKPGQHHRNHHSQHKRELRSKIVAKLHRGHRLFLTAVMLAIKFAEDRLFSIEVYAKVGGLAKAELAALEIRFLKTLKFDLYVSRPQFHDMVRTIISHSQEML